MAEWVDFKELKKTVSLEMVLSHYGVLGQLKPSGKNLYGCCPIHNGTNNSQFSVNLSKNAWRCFGDCQLHGNQLDFVVAMEKLSGNNSIRKAALLLKNWFSVDCNHSGPVKISTKKETQKNLNCELVRKKINESERYKPIGFALAPLIFEHPFFQERQILSETAKYFGTGFYNKKGSMKNRVVFPIHDQKGQLWGYCGRAVNKGQANVDGKYKLPANFSKQDFVFNLHRQAKGLNRVIVVESFLSVLWLHQCGYKNVISIMGSSLSTKQESLILNKLDTGGQIILMFDTDQSGQNCIDDCLCRLGRKVWVRTVGLPKLSNGKINKPHKLSATQLGTILDVAYSGC